jgi:hypothetical protein
LPGFLAAAAIGVESPGIAGLKLSALRSKIGADPELRAKQSPGAVTT